MTTPAHYRRVLLKLSGESFARTGERGISMDEVLHIARQTVQAAARGVQLAVVIGGGNILRGASFTAGNTGVHEATAHYMGMLATVINGLALSDALESHGVPTRVMSAIDVHKVCEPFIRRRAIRHMEKGRVVIFAAGTGSPYFTTDTAAALRATEMNCDAIFKGTQVDGVYSADPKQEPDAERYYTLTYMDVLSRDLRVMDASAISLARENNIPILVFSIHNPNAFAQVVKGDGTFTIISDTP